MFDKSGFMEYVRENFSFDVTFQRLLESVIEYGVEHFGHSKNAVSYFVYDILCEVESIDFEEIEQFDW